MNFDIQFDRECLKCKAIKMTFGRGPLLLPFIKKFLKRREKNTIVTLKIHDRKRERLNMFR